MSVKHVKCVLVGDGGVGKRSLIVTFTSNSFPHEYISSVMHPCSVNIMAGSKQVDLELWYVAPLPQFFSQHSIKVRGGAGGL